MTEIRQEIIPFEGKQILTFNEDGEIKVAIKPICEDLEIGWEPQRKRIRRTPSLNSVTSIMEATGADGKRYKMLCLTRKGTLEWMTTLNPNITKNPLKREMILEYKQHLGPALQEHWDRLLAVPIEPRFRPVQIEARQELVPFLDTEILVAFKDGIYCVAADPLIERFGGSREYNSQKIMWGDPFDYAAVEIEAVGADGKRRKMRFLPVNHFIVWLGRIRGNLSVNPQAAALIRIYQLYLPWALHEYIWRSAQAPQLEGKRIALLEENAGSRPAGKRRSHCKIDMLPLEIRQEVIEMLTIKCKTYQQIVDYLEKKGYSISHSAVGRYAKRYVSSRGEVR